MRNRLNVVAQRLAIRAIVGMVGWSVLSMPISAQETVRPANQTPTPSTSDAMSRAEEILTHSLALHLDGVPLDKALKAVAQSAGVVIAYSAEALPEKRVSLVTDQISVRDALSVLLEGTGLEAVVAAPGFIAVRPIAGSHPSRMSTAIQQGTATLTGSVTDSGTGATISQVTVHIDGTSLSVKSSALGQYKFTNIAAGEYRVTARRVGYLAKTRTVTLADGDNKKLDFGLNPPATQLNEVVTTALGEQRRYQVGNVISTINVDSIAPNAPVTSVTDLISGRAPGVEVMESSGLVGGGDDIRIRGVSSMLLQSDPIIIVDGIRQDNTPGGAVIISNVAPAPSRINDLDFTQIESIDILKGPTATTEYGTDAANGVIVITTKRGVSGRTQWTASANYTAADVPTSSLPNYYWNWGHTANGLASPVTNTYGSCLLGPIVGFGPSFPDLTGGGCVVDSVTAFNPEKHAATSEFGTGPTTKYDLDVGGGSDALRYYFAGGWSSALGPTHLPNVFLPEARAYGFPQSSIDPNSETQSNIRANTVIHVSPTVDVQTNVAYMSTEVTTPVAVTQLGVNDNGPLVNDSAYNYGYGLTQYGNSPLTSLGNQSNQQTERWTGGSTINMRPLSWLAMNLVLGIDHGAQTETGEHLPVSLLVFNGDTAGGSISQQVSTNDVYTVDFRGNATTTLLHRFRLMTSFGLQYTEVSSGGLFGSVSGLAANNFSLDGSGGTPQLTQSAQQVKTGGAYVEENFGIGDRCYLPLALRLDAASGFGYSVAGGGASYPKYGISCLVLTGTTTLRVRESFGASGQQPPDGAALQEYTSYPLGTGAGPTASVVDFDQPGNATLQAERSQEFEGGFDLGLWGSRVQGEFSAYTKATQHALYSLSPGFDLPSGSYTENIGDVSNIGWEASLTAVILQSRMIGWSLTANTSVNNNKLVKIAPGIITTYESGAGQMLAQGYPVYGYWATNTLYADANHDGILERDEVRFGMVPTYQGNSLPPDETSLATSLSLLRGTLTMNALFDYKTGYKVFNLNNTLDLAGANAPTAPLWQQASEIELQNFGYSYTNLNFTPGTFLRFRELSVACALPRQWQHMLRLSNLSLVGAVRNLALWTRYPFGDPEVSDGQQSAFNFATATSSVNNDDRSVTSNVVPLNRQWTLRLNVGW